MAKQPKEKTPKIEKIFIATRVLPYLADKVKADAAKQDRSVMWVINHILTKWYESKGGVNK
jgi:hypothetical protein